MLIISQWIFAIFATLLALSVGWWIALSSGDIKEFGRALVSWCMVGDSLSTKSRQLFAHVATLCLTLAFPQKPTKSRTKTDSGNMSQVRA
jgi:hypothetical protein